jgi:CheY-like chemotaxis protein
LVVDEQENLSLLVDRLLGQKNPCIIRVEDCAAKAISAAEEFHPDLILMDMAIPALDGGEVAGQIRANPALETIPIVFLAGLEIEGEASADNMRFLAKPYRGKAQADGNDQQFAE